MSLYGRLHVHVRIITTDGKSGVVPGFFRDQIAKPIAFVQSNGPLHPCGTAQLLVVAETMLHSHLTGQRHEDVLLELKRRGVLDLSVAHDERLQLVLCALLRVEGDLVAAGLPLVLQVLRASPRNGFGVRLHQNLCIRYWIFVLIVHMDGIGPFLARAILFAIYKCALLLAGLVWQDSDSQRGPIKQHLRSGSRVDQMDIHFVGGGLVRAVCDLVNPCIVHILRNDLEVLVGACRLQSLV
mmetsp:Transcript_107180/g.181054  ORF Transcript_107180/g.181054 Transcript_107180/m.181054 type:complete len:240 (-) Transcript_107180:180-899(-)